MATPKTNGSKNTKTNIPLTLAPSASSYPTAYAEDIWDDVQSGTALVQKLGAAGQYDQHTINEQLAEAAANGGYQAPDGGIPASDLAQSVQDSLNAADSAIQQIEIGASSDIDQSGTPSVSVTPNPNTKKSVLTFHNLKGEPGQQGQDGASAYQIWLNSGNSGTEQDFLNSLKGQDGANGTSGTNGTNGNDGATWHSGTAVTGTSTTAATFSVSNSKAGDFYLNTSTFNVYKATAANKWVYVGNIKGAAGANALGVRWFMGEDLSSAGTITTSVFASSRYSFFPKVGDMYLNPTLGYLYRCSAVNQTETTWQYVKTLDPKSILVIDGVTDGGANNSADPIEMTGVSIKLGNTQSSSTSANYDHESELTGIEVIIEGLSSRNKAIYAVAHTGYAGYFDGAVRTGRLTAEGSAIIRGSTTTHGDLTADGDITGAAIYQTSDDRLKDYMGQFAFDINRLNDIPLLYFKYKNGNTKQIGTSAQALEKVIPEIVGEQDDGFKTVDYSKLAIVALDCIRQQQQRIEQLQKEIDNLKKRML